MVDGLTEHWGDHVGPAFDQRRSATRVAMGGGRLDHVGYYSSITDDFQFDLLDVRPPPTGVDPDEYRTLAVEAGRQLCYTVARTDRTLVPAASGPLIRTVIQTDSGVVCCYSVIPGQDVVSIRLGGAVDADPSVPLPDRAGVRDADETTARLVTVIRGDLHLSSRDPGGYERIAIEGAPSGSPVAELSGPGSDEGVRRLLAERLRVDGLHYVAYVRDGRVHTVADVLADPRLAGFTAQASAATRRDFLSSLAGSLPTLLREFNRLVRPVIGGPVRRLVLDVEQGSVYVYTLGSQGLLLAVTLFQHSVETADLAAAGLAGELSAALRVTGSPEERY